MSQTDPSCEGHHSHPDEQQRPPDQTFEQCQAIAVSTSEQCERDAIGGVPYCPLHLDQLEF